MKQPQDILYNPGTCEIKALYRGSKHGVPGIMMKGVDIAFILSRETPFTSPIYILKALPNWQADEANLNIKQTQRY